ncbi:methyl-accepting chemotaxis protein [Poseidonocella sedimentorum]|uniref:methyl-accepting chemotaxis protein n=1 Tax=Poseidonocella sedimentorum TaxID=871652 RepID=UPI0015A4F226|nr:methyl-accepting chemotaxis protein [Poseidonocella sedimentorum]
MAHLGSEQLANKVAGLLAGQVSGAFRFGKHDTVVPLLEDTLKKSNGSFTALLGVDSSGAVVASAGAIDTPAAQEAAALAQAAVAAGERQSSADRQTVAYPVKVGDGDALGAVAIVATTEPMLTIIAGDLQRSGIIAAIILTAALVGSAVLLRIMISKPLTRVGAAMHSVGEGDLGTEVPLTGRGDEIGGIARQLDAFRLDLQAAEAASADAIRKGAGFQNSSAAMVMLDTEGTVEASNPAAAALLGEKLGLLADANALVGMKFASLSSSFDGVINAASGQEHSRSEVVENGVSLATEINTVRTPEGEIAGMVIEIADITEARINASIFEAMDAENVRAAFDETGAFIESNSNYADVMGSRSNSGLSDIASFEGASGADVMSRLGSGESLFGRFEFAGGAGESKIIDGALCAVKDASGKVFRIVATGRDVTAATRALDASNARAEKMQSEQATAVSGIRKGLENLSRGDFTVRIDEPFAPDYETLRSDFNEAISLIENTVISINERAENINGEISSISESSTNLSERTEKQASTLAESVAAITQISAAVTTAADGAREAERLVASARSDAENSEQVVEQAIDAVGKIEASSQRISQIVSVIDDIAFQTNLLALNAGVEAARAGDSGRGFAVVASEVRELAQRSSKAAKEISDVIQKSRVDVENGVQLVRRAGDALNEIAGSVSQISDHVGGIATSSNEQSEGLSQISEAMNQLDSVTQHNVGTFEETAAAISVLSNETTELKQALGGFTVNWTSPTSTPVAAVSAHVPHAVSHTAPVKQVANGAPVQEFHMNDSEEAWADF